MSNVIKAAHFLAGQISSDADKSEKIVIDSNPRADLFLSGLHKSRELSGVPSEEMDEPESTSSLPLEVESAIREQAARILDEAKLEERRIKEQALKEAKIQKQRVLDDAREEGYRIGYESGLATLQEMEDKLKERMVQNQLEYQAEIERLEPMFADLVVQYVEKLTGYVMDEKRQVIGYLMKEAIRGTDPSRSYVIHVSPEEYRTALAQEADLKDIISGRASLEIVMDNHMKHGECKIETDTCVLDSGIGTRLDMLKENLRLLIK